MCPSEFVVAPKVVTDELNLIGMQVHLTADGRQVINPTFERDPNDEVLQAAEHVEEERFKAQFNFKPADNFDFDTLTSYEQRTLRQLDDE